MGDTVKYLASFGIGFVAGVAAQYILKKLEFSNKLKQELSENNINLINCNPGRDENGDPVWKITIKDDRLGVSVLRARFDNGFDHYDEITLRDVVQRTLKFVNSERALA